MMAMSDQQRIDIPSLCELHQSLLVQQVGVGPDGPWRALMIMATIALFQGATADPSTHERLENDILRLPELGCLACYKPDLFGELVDAVQRGGMSAIKSLGERWIRREVQDE